MHDAGTMMRHAIPSGVARYGNPSTKPGTDGEPSSSSTSEDPSEAGRTAGLTRDRRPAIVVPRLTPEEPATPGSRLGDTFPERPEPGVSSCHDLSCHCSVLGDRPSVGPGSTSHRTMTPTPVGGRGSKTPVFSPAPFRTLVLTREGVSLSVAGSLGVQVSPLGELSTRNRSVATPWAELRELWPKTYRARADDLARKLYPNGIVGAAMTKRLRATIRAHEIRVLEPGSSQKTTPTSTAKAAEFWSTVLLTASYHDAVQLGNLQRRTCGSKTWEFTREDGTTQIVRWRCHSERCRHCSKHKSVQMANRLSGQLAADATSLETDVDYRGRPVFMTLTWDHRRIMAEHDVDHNGARILAWSLARRARARFVEQLRGKRRHGKRDGKYPELQYFCRTELHQNGMPHLHLALVSPRLTRDMQGSNPTYRAFLAKHRRRVSRWRADVERWRAGNKTGRKPRCRIAFSKLRSELAAMATAAGFGKVFWLEPMRNSSAAGTYLTKDSWASTGASELAGELTKTSQTGRREVGPPVIPRGQRMTDTSREFWTVDVAQEEPKALVVSVSLHDAPIELVRKYALSRGSQVISEQDQADMRGEVHPEPGERWPRQIVLASLMPPPDGVAVRGWDDTET